LLVDGWGFTSASFATNNPARSRAEAGRSALAGVGLRSTVPGIPRGGLDGTVPLGRADFEEFALDGMGAGVVKPGLGWDGSEGNGCAGFAGRAVAGVDVAPTDFSAVAIVPVAGLSSAGGFGVASLSCWISVGAFAGALCPASAMGLEPGFDSDGSGGGEVAGADAAGFCNRKPFSSATDSALEPVGGVGAGVAA